MKHVTTVAAALLATTALPGIALAQGGPTQPQQSHSISTDHNADGQGGALHNKLNLSTPDKSSTGTLSGESGSSAQNWNDHGQWSGGNHHGWNSQSGNSPREMMHALRQRLRNAGLRDIRFQLVIHARTRNGSRVVISISPPHSRPGDDG